MEEQAIVQDGGVLEPVGNGRALVAGIDPDPRETLRAIREQLQIEQDMEEEPGDWVAHQAEVDTLINKIQAYTFHVKKTISSRFRKSKKAIQEYLPEVQTGDEMTQELEAAWNLYTRGSPQISSRDIGYVLRILGQNPTEDEIVEMVMKANCEWDGVMTRSDFLAAGIDILKGSCDLKDDVKAAFKVFDHNNDGSISREELREAMVNFGTRCTDEEFACMFEEADKNQDGRIDFEEFQAMMLPGS